MEAASLSLAPARDAATPVDAGTEAVAPLLALTGIVKSWRTLPRPVLDGIDLAIEGGRAIHISGRNGVGKTTLLRIITGLITPDEGKLSLGGFDPERDRRAYSRQVAFLSAGDQGLYARLSVRRHMNLWARVALLPRRERADLIEKAIGRFELEELADRRVDRLSMGQRQRVRLAGLLLHRPSLVMLDEPTNSLDDEGIAMAVATFKEVMAEGGSIIWCSPAGEKAVLDFDAAYALEAGRLVRR